MAMCNQSPHSILFFRAAGITAEKNLCKVYSLDCSVTVWDDKRESFGSERESVERGSKMFKIILHTQKAHIPLSDSEQALELKEMYSS